MLVGRVLCQQSGDTEQGLYLLLDSIGQAIDHRLSRFDTSSDRTEVERGAVHRSIFSTDLDITDVARVGIVGIAQTSP